VPDLRQRAADSPATLRNAGIRIKVFDVDFDTSKPLLRQLGVQMQSTLIVYHGAKETGRMTGATDPAVIKRLLETSAS
jgi:thioredoxin 1